MQILLLENVKGIGKRMEVKTVSDGYARNFLIPRKLAAPADETMLAKQRAWQAAEAAQEAERRRFAERLTRETFPISIKAGKNGEVYGSITPAQIQKLLAEQGFGNVEVALEHPIRTLGTHEVEVRFGGGIRGTARITAEPSP